MVQQYFNGFTRDKKYKQNGESYIFQIYETMTIGISTTKKIALKPFLLLLFFGCFNSCVEEPETLSTEIRSENPEQIVVISNNAPGKYAHILKQDSLGKKIEDSVGPKMFLPHYGFSYLDSQNVIQTWIPEEGVRDTLVIPYYKEYLEVASYNPYTSIKESFLEYIFKNIFGKQLSGTANRTVPGQFFVHIIT